MMHQQGCMWLITLVIVCLVPLSNGNNTLKLQNEDKDFVSLTSLNDINNESSIFQAIKYIRSNGENLYIRKDLLLKIYLERSSWHMTPWVPTRTKTVDNFVVEQDCIASNSIESFPDSIFQDEQLRKGGFFLYLLMGVYSFVLIAYICNDYFVPCVELICEDLNIPQHVAAATFMSVATSCPEFFTNAISTFLTQSDMGIGTIIGSALFNTLGVAAVGGLAASKPIPINSRAMTRDVVIYIFNLSVLVAIVWDGQVDWYEAVVLAVLYVLYFVFMFNSVRLFALSQRLVERYFRSKATKELEQNVENANNNNVISEPQTVKPSIVITKPDQEKSEVSSEESLILSPLNLLIIYPKNKGILVQVWWVVSWPIKLVLALTIPSPVFKRRFYPFAFLMCITWIGASSYCVSWSMTVIGYTFFIPDSVMGMTFLAFGGCVPEACSIYIMSRRGEGGIGVSNALGANSLAILFALGLPWFIRSITLVAQGAEQPAILINSAGIDVVLVSILVAVIVLWLTLFIGKFKLRKIVGTILAAFYVVFITFTVLIELGVILDRGLQFC